MRIGVNKLNQGSASYFIFCSNGHHILHLDVRTFCSYWHILQQASGMTTYEFVSENIQQFPSAEWRTTGLWVPHSRGWQVIVQHFIFSTAFEVSEKSNKILLIFPWILNQSRIKNTPLYFFFKLYFSGAGIIWLPVLQYSIFFLSKPKCHLAWR